MKKLLFLLSIIAVGCTAEETDACGKVTNKQAFYNSSNGMYDYTLYINGNPVKVSEQKYINTSKGDYACQ